MSLSDMDDEDRAIREMNEAHEHREKHEEYCTNCNHFFSRYLPHTCFALETEKLEREKFQQTLIDYLNFGLKEGFIDEHTADYVRFEYDYELQVKWLGEMEIKAEAQAEAWEEHQHELQEGRDNEH